MNKCHPREVSSMILDVFVLAKQQLQGLWAVRSHSQEETCRFQKAIAET